MGLVAVGSGDGGHPVIGKLDGRLGNDKSQAAPGPALPCKETGQAGCRLQHGQPLLVFPAQLGIFQVDQGVHRVIGVTAVASDHGLVETGPAPPALLIEVQLGSKSGPILVWNQTAQIIG